MRTGERARARGARPDRERRAERLRFLAADGSSADVLVTGSESAGDLHRSVRTGLGLNSSFILRKDGAVAALHPSLPAGTYTVHVESPAHSCVEASESSFALPYPVVARHGDPVNGYVNQCQFRDLNDDAVPEYICSIHLDEYTPADLNCVYINTAKGWKLI